MKCDELNLAGLLIRDERQQDPNDNEVNTVRHLETCDACRTRLTSLAAKPEQWEELHRVLPSDPLSAEIESESIQAYERWVSPAVWSESMVQSLLSPPGHPEMLGRLGRYDIERMIGSGGMGVVLKAFDTELNRPVALKMLAPYLAENGSARQRFAREGRAAAAVVDDHVVPIYNVESDGNALPFLVMQYIAGGSLQQRLDRDGPLSLAEVLRIGMQTAQGLAAAHAQGLIHRDVKPSNILLDEGVERALLTDFGLARTEDDACLTRSGFQPGTPLYMSPEQVRGEAIDARSDLFSLGCVLYALCTGHPPFQAGTGYAVMRRIVDDEPRFLRERRPDLPEWLEAIIARLLAKSPDDRFECADDVAELLRNCLAHIQHPARVPLPVSLLQPKLSGGRTRRSSWSRRAVAAALIAISCAVALFLLQRPGDQSHEIESV
ncbi:MAG: serine/threonine protein kinase, partial [Planctomycetaceae bacterium]|nr:serine/threonine protein kinase [Planctomycetaceae bacterium]